MADDVLQLTIKMQDQATATLKALGTSLDGLAKQAGTATEAMNKQAAATSGFASVLEKLTGTTNLTSAAIATLTRAHVAGLDTLKQYAGSAGAVGEALAKFGPAGAVAAGAVGLLVEQSVKGVEAWAKWEQAQIRFDLAIKNSGQSGKTTFAQLNQEARNISKGTVFDADAMTEAMAKLSRNGALSMDKVRSLMPKVADIAADKNMTVQEAASLVSTLYSSPERGIAMMQRNNKNMTNSERQKLLDMVHAGRPDEAADAAVERMSSGSRGQAQALTQGVTGAWDQVKKEMDDFSSQYERGVGQMVAKTLNLEGALKAVASALRSAKSEFADRNAAELDGNTPQNRIRAAEQGMKDVRSGRAGAYLSAGSGDEGPGVAMFAMSQEKNMIADLQAKIDQAYEDMREHGHMNNQGEAGFDTNRLAKQKWDNATTELDKTDQVAKKQHDLNIQISAFEEGLKSAKMAMGEAFDQKKVDQMTAALNRTKNELANVSSAYDQITKSFTGQEYGATLSNPQKIFNDEYTKLATARAKDLGANPDQLSLDPLTREKAGTIIGANGEPITEKALKDIMDAVMKDVVDHLGKMQGNQLLAETATRKEELSLILKAMQPGAAGRDASNELSALRNSQKYSDPRVREAARQTDLNYSHESNSYRNQIEVQQTLDKFQQQATQASLQTALMTGKGGTFQTGTFTANGDNNASSIATLLRQYGANDTQIAAVLGNFQQESSLNPAMSGMDKGLPVAGLASWRGSRYSGLAKFAGVNDPSQATMEQQISYMMQEINSNPAMRKMWSEISGQDLGTATDRFGQVFEGYGDDSAATRRANASKFMSGGSLIIKPGAAVGEADARRIAGLTPEAIKLAVDTGMSPDQAMSMLSRASSTAQQANNTTTLAGMNITNRQSQLLNSALDAGGPVAMRQKQWELDAFNKGFTGDQGKAYIAAQQGSADNANNRTLIEKVQAQRDSIELTNKEADLATSTAEQRQRELDLLRLKQEASKAGYDTDSDGYKKMVESINAAADAQERLRRSQGPIGEWIAQSKDDWKTWEDAAVSAIGTAESGFANLLTGTTDLKTGIADLAKSLANLAANAAFKSIFNSVLGGSGGFLQTLIGGGAATTASSAIAKSGDIMAAYGFADGGIMGPDGSLPLHRYASGGVATSPQLALFGEGAHNEAYVPLPDGRSIPVTMAGGGGSQNHTVLAPQINITVQGGDGGMQGGQGNNMDHQAMGQLVASAVHNQMVNLLTEQSRPGGALNPIYGH